MAFSWFLGKRRHETAGERHADALGDVAATIQLRVEDGLLMAFGPDGDPMPPALVKSLCADDPKGTLQLESGETVDRRCVLNILDAQQKGQLADHPVDGWVEAMLCLGGAFEPTPPRLLDDEPLGIMPSRPERGDDEPAASQTDPETEVLTPLAFDEAERRSMAKADAVLVKGLPKGVSLSSGRYDKAVDGWILLPGQLPSLKVQRSEQASKTAEIDVMAIALKQKNRRWSVTIRTMELA
ncbi:MAG: hypothetical protein AAGA21_14260 [Pseudomonadota bacterium]